MKTRFTLALLLLAALPALTSQGWAQTPQILPAPGSQPAQGQATVNQQLQQTDQNNAQVQQSLQRNANRQQRQFNAMPAPAYKQPHVYVKPPTTTP